MARREETTRMCALTRAEKPVAELIRFVLGPDDVLVPDTDAKAEGRGVWLSLNKDLVAEAIKRKVFARSLKSEVKLPDDLVGWSERKDGETKRFEGTFKDFPVSREEAEDMILQARIKAGWINEEDLPPVEGEEIADEEATA